MGVLKNLKISNKLNLVVLTAAIGFLAFGLLAVLTINAVKVNGEMYKQISLYKALDSDCAPPALYLIEARMYVLSMLLDKDPSRVKEYIAQFEDHRNGFEATYKRYLQTLPDGALKEQLSGTEYKEGAEWLQIVETRVIPAKLQNDDKTAVQILMSDARPHFDAHQKADQDLAKATEEVFRKQEEGASNTVSSRITILVVWGAAILGTVVFLGWIIARIITSSLNKTMAVLQSLADGDFRKRVDIDTEDEAGIMGDALNRTLERLSTTIRSISETAEQVAGASDRLNSSNQEISALSEKTSAQAAVVSQASQQVNQNLQSVSTGSEEMTSTIQSISSNAHEAATVASNAVQTAQAANATVAKLGDSSAEIGDVIKVITSIAQQTNLLALNATIEAARAGEAGKGFAVVANEVKELAKQTAKATEDISRRITTIQSDTKGAVEAIGSIASVIHQVNDISGTIATAVEEQSATTNEMTRNVSDAAKGSSEISQNIAAVAEAVRGTATSAQESQKAAQELAEMSGQLHSLVATFRLEGTGVKPERTRAGAARTFAASAGY